MKSTITLLGGLMALALSPGRAFGQQNFQPAKVTTLAGDTLRGYIDYRGWDRNPKLIVFKPDLQAPSQTFRPLDIKGFRVSGEQYAGSQVVIENSLQNLDALPASPAPVFRTDTTFLRAIISGPRSLYSYKVNGREYLYTEEQGKFDLLIYKRFKPATTYTVIRFNNTYQEQLAKYLAACPTAEQQSKQLLYTRSSVQRLFKNYYACIGQQAVFQKKKIVLQAGVLVGVTRSALRFNAEPSYGPAPVFDSYTTNGPTGGLYLYIPLPGNLGHFSINNDVTFTSFSASGTTTITSGPDNYTRLTSSLALTYLKLNTQLRFTHPVGVGTLFINAGMSNGYAIRAQNERTTLSNFYSTQKTTTEKIFPMETYESGLVAGLGGSMKRLSAEARYESSGGFLNMINLSSHFNRYSLLVGYRLF